MLIISILANGGARSHILDESEVDDFSMFIEEKGVTWAEWNRSFLERQPSYVRLKQAVQILCGTESRIHLPSEAARHLLRLPWFHLRSRASTMKWY